MKWDTKAPNRAFRRLNGAFGHHWHPSVVVMDHRLVEGRRFIGYPPPDVFVAQVEGGRSSRCSSSGHGMRGRSSPTCSPAFRMPTSRPRRCTGKASRADRVGGGLPALTDVWRELADRYPTSERAVRADCLEGVIPPTGFRMSDPTAVRLVAAPAA